jgi:hypothetical protein
MNDNVLYYGLCFIGLLLIISAFFILTKDNDNQ